MSRARLLAAVGLVLLAVVVLQRVTLSFAAWAALATVMTAIAMTMLVRELRQGAAPLGAATRFVKNLLDTLFGAG